MMPMTSVSPHSDAPYAPVRDPTFVSGAAINHPFFVPGTLSGHLSGRSGKGRESRGPNPCSLSVRYLIFPLLLVASCASTSPAVISDNSGAANEPIEIALSLYIVDETDDSNSDLSSQRDVAGVEQIVERIQAIWRPAGIEFSIAAISRVDASTEMLSSLASGETGGFLNGLYNGSVALPKVSAINGFYVRSLGTINGIAPLGSGVFFVTDEPSVHDERVSSHEIGHILGLHHAIDDSNRLMFSGTNGMNLVEAEISVARYNAEGIASGAR